MPFNGTGSNVTSLNASNISSGTVAPARLGSGSPSSSNFLRGDGTWAVPASSANLQQVLFTSSTTWTCPAGVTRVYAIVIGGGGGAFQSSFGGDGGTGGMGSGFYTVVPGTNYSITVGNGGNAGGTGGTSSFASFLSCTGGTTGNGDGFAGFIGVATGSNYGTPPSSLRASGYVDGSVFTFIGNGRRAAGSTGVAYSSGSILPGAGGVRWIQNCINQYSGGMGGVVLLQFVG